MASFNWPPTGGNGSVTALSVATVNGFSGSFSASTTPVLTLSTTVTGILQGDGTAISAASTTGSGSVVLANSPILITPALGTPSALVGTNITGTAAGLTAGHTTTNANLTGPIASIGNATSITAQTGTGTTFVMSVAPSITGGLGVTGAITGSSSLTLGTTSVSGGNLIFVGNSPSITFTSGQSGIINFNDGTISSQSSKLTISTGATNKPLALIPNGTGGILLGNSTDNANGLLQLNASTSATSGIAFGNDTPNAAIYRSAASTLMMPGKLNIAGADLAVGLGTTTGAFTTSEQFSSVYSLTSNTAASVNGIGSSINVSGNTAQTTNIRAGRFQATRTVTGTTTDSGSIIGISSSIVIGNGANAYTNTSTGVIPSAFGVIALATGATAPTMSYAGLAIATDSTAITGTKYGILVNGGTTGGSNNATLADNMAFTGNYFINQSGTTTTVLGGLVNLSGASAGQIQFPATQHSSANANTLDDYSEGTWTPTLNSWTNVGSPSFAGCTYTKIGRLVFLTIVITPGTSISSVLGTSTITNLPFAAAQISSGTMVNSGTPTSFGSVVMSAAGGGTIYPSTTGVIGSQVEISICYVAAT